MLFELIRSDVYVCLAVFVIIQTVCLMRLWRLKNEDASYLDSILGTKRFSDQSAGRSQKCSLCRQHTLATVERLGGILTSNHSL